MRHAAQTSVGSGDPLQGLAAKLHAARRRLLVERLLRIVAHAVATASLAVLAVVAASVFAPISPTARDVMLVASFGGGVVLLAGSVWAIMRLPPALALARRADRMFGLQESLSTALEATRRRDRAGALTRALITDGGKKAGGLDPKRLVRMKLLRPALGACLLAALAAGALALSGPGLPAAPVADSLAGSPATTETPLTETERLTLAKDLRQVAARAADAPDAADDAAVQAVVRELNRVSDRIASGALSDSAAVRRELDRALSHLSPEGVPRATTSSGAQELSRAVAAAVDRMESPAMASGPSDLRAPPAAEALADSTEQQNSVEANASEPMASDAAAAPTGPSGQSGPTDGGATREPRGTAFERQLVEQECMSSAIDGADPCVAQNMAAAPEPVAGDPAGQTAGASPSRAEPEAMDNGYVIGASQRSGQGESTEAGRGSQELAGARNWLPDASAFGEEIVLEERELTGEGQRFRLTRPPQADVAELDGPGAGGRAWRSLPEHEVARASVPPELRAAVARYFRPGQEAP